MGKPKRNESDDPEIKHNTEYHLCLKQVMSKRLNELVQKELKQFDYFHEKEV